MVDQATTLEHLGLAAGSPDIKSVGPLAFGPEGVLFVGDNVGAAIFAIDVERFGSGGARQRPLTWTTWTVPWRPTWAVPGRTSKYGTWPSTPIPGMPTCR